MRECDNSEIHISNFLLSISFNKQCCYIR